jgi:hypothetical protein
MYLIAKVANNRLAYLGNKFPVEITVQAKKANGERATLTLSKQGKVLYSEELVFPEITTAKYQSWSWMLIKLAYSATQ